MPLVKTAHLIAISIRKNCSGEPETLRKHQPARWQLLFTAASEPQVFSGLPLPFLYWRCLLAALAVAMAALNDLKIQLSNARKNNICLQTVAKISRTAEQIEFWFLKNMLFNQTKI